MPETVTISREEFEQLRQNETRLQLLLKSLPVALYIAEPHGDYGGTWVSDQIVTFTGFSPAQFLVDRHLWAGRLHPDDQERVLRTYGEVKRNQYIEVEYRWRVADGNYRWFRDTATLARDSSGKGDKVIGTWLDITERRLAQEKLQQAEQRLHTVFEESPVSLWIEDVSDVLACLERLRSGGITDFTTYFADYPEAVRLCLEKLKVLDVNRATLSMYGVASKHDLIGSLAQTFTDDSLRAFTQLLVALAEGRTEIDLETQARKLSGELIYSQVKWKLAAGKERVPLMLVSMVDISERRKTKLALEKSERRYRTLFDNAGDIIQILDREGRYLYVNPAWTRTFGYSPTEAATMRVFDLIHPDCADVCSANFTRVLVEGALENVEISFKARDGRKVLLEGNVNCQKEDNFSQYVQCIFRDVTVRRKMEEELRKAHKLESIGVLAGGIAHDFNNILTSVIGNISLARIYAQPGDKIYEKLCAAEQAILRARDLTQQLLTFSRGGEPVKRLIDVRQVLREASGFVLRGSNVKAVCLLPEDLWAVRADEGQLNQVVYNLLINADQAMPEGGQVTIAAGNHFVATGDSLALPEGNYVAVSVQDQGTGIKAEHLDLIFDPYFSTKQKGKGLGLASAYSIVKNHGGMLTVSSTLGRGSTFTFYLPASPEEVAQEKEERPSLHQGKGRVLVMDDEEGVREVVSAMLIHLGYEVTVVVDGRKALEVYGRAMREGNPFALVIMDLTIPGGMGGKETVARLLSLDPAAKAVVSSGYASDPIMAKYKDFGFAGVIPKPFKIELLSDVLARLLT